MTYDPGFYDVIAQGCRDSAAEVVPVLMNLFAPERVIDVGCGEGHWLAEFRRHGCQVLGIDGHHVQLDRLAIDPVNFRPADLANPPLYPQRHDLCLSLEVGEHLPAQAARRYVASLAQSAPVVVFSAAIPGQGGTGHVNEQWPDYWAELFAEQGYTGTGALRWLFWDNPRIENWYRQNLIVFANPLSDTEPLSPEARGLWEGPMATLWPVVHPVLWDARRPQ